METTALTWLFAIILLALTSMLAIDFARGWREGKRDARAEKTPAQPEAEKPEKVSKSDTAPDAGIDLMGMPRPTFKATLPPDGKQMRLRMPTKAVSDRFEALGEILKRFEKKKQTLDDIEQLYLLAAMLLANNLDGEVVTVAGVRERLTLDDVVEFLVAYMHWLTDILQSKN